MVTKNCIGMISSSQLRIRRSKSPAFVDPMRSIKVQHLNVSLLPKKKRSLMVQCLNVSLLPKNKRLWKEETNVVICSICRRPQCHSIETTLVSPSSSRDDKSDDTPRHLMVIRTLVILYKPWLSLNFFFFFVPKAFSSFLVFRTLKTCAIHLFILFSLCQK